MNTELKLRWHLNIRCSKKNGAFMKKVIASIFLLFSLSFCIFSQENLSIDLNDEIYKVLEIAQERGLCSHFSGARPYSLRRIKLAIDQIMENSDSLKPEELKIIENFTALHALPEKNKFSLERVYWANKQDTWRCSFNYTFGLEASGSGGLYTDSDFNQAGFDLIPFWDFYGDASKFVSYRLHAFFDISSMELYEPEGDDYFIGYAWYDTGVEEYCGGYTDVEPRRRTVKKFLNTSYLPFAYNKQWDGQFYLFSDMSANGTGSWATEPGISGGIKGEIRSSIFDGKITLGAARMEREWAAMDEGSSLVLNAKARPFFSVDTTVELFSFLKYSSLTGVLEYPNQDYMNSNSYAEFKAGIDDSYFFQNAFSLNMLELDWKYFHFDFGSSSVWPKRFEIGYMFPLFLLVEYQNHIGDSDNLAVFADFKLRKPGLGSIWASIYLDEINGLNNNPLTSTRAMFAGQLGAKFVIPWLNFSKVSMRYTKVEPYCYTHHSINYSSAYSHYISESYTNNGECLGYYLPPNSDEFLVRFDTKPKAGIATNVQYQFIRHGADYGSQQVPGSSLYSEMNIYNRDDLRKYFLHDGAYNWMHILSAQASVESRKTRIPFKVTANAGFVFSYYTVIDSDVYNDKDSNGVSAADENTSFHFIDSAEYPVMCGAVLGLGIKLFGF